ncbi:MULTISPECIES: winged helix-turn-helix domain-containing protein [unclassified Streptomyces]|uniref:winged helix-turn-helix domain-containing protein n=1 Tax=unclassified Streptomyces TaxID=2593676 RepID=UPI00332125C7
MANSRSFSAVHSPAAAVPTVRGTGPGTLNPGRHRLRAIDRDEVVPLGGLGTLGGLVDVMDLLPPGATWLPAPQHNVAGLPGRPPMLGYLVLVPAEQQAPAGPLPEAGRLDTGESAGPVRIDASERTAYVDGRMLDLTYLEFELLAHLVAHPQRVHTRDQLVTTVWGYGHVGDGRTVDVHVARLRRKLGAEHRRTIQTVRRVGYKYAP